MTEPVRTDADRAAEALDGRERDVRVEQLLLTGLDHYFAARYERAIHVWTRVLFLDRGHARARAYIDRARSALAERQRETDELLHRGTAAFESGNADDARRLLTAAVERGAAPEVALAYLGRLDRLEPVPPPEEPRTLVTRSDTVATTSSDPSRSRPWRAAFAGLILLVVTLAMAIWFAGPLMDLSGGSIATEAADAPVQVGEPVIVPNASDATLARARLFFTTGHVRDALQLLESIGVADPNRAEADRLQAEIQRTLLAAQDPQSAASMSTVR
jgi:hypothetical protein